MSETYTNPTILHVDMDAFFASVEARDDPLLKGCPIVVCGLGRRGVVSSAAYEARRFGIRSAMPTVTARRLCPQGVFVPPRFAAYRQASRVIMAVLGSYTPLVEPIALDEAFLDVSGSRRLFGDGPEIARQAKARILEETGLVASVGVAGSKFVAKLASGKAKPDGILIVDAAETLSFLHALDVSDLWGVGAATQRVLREMGIRTVSDLARTPRDSLAARLGDSLGAHLHELAHGSDERPVNPVRPTKSIGHETTFEADLTSAVEIDRELLRLADAVSIRLRAGGLAGRTIGLKVRFATMKTVTRSRTLEKPADVTNEIVGIARELFSLLALNAPRVRLLGISAGKLVPSRDAVQLALGGGEESRGWDAASRASDRIRQRFGADAIARAALVQAVNDTSDSGDSDRGPKARGSDFP